MHFNKSLKIGLIVIGAIILTTLTISGAIWVSHAETRKAEAAYPKCQGQHQTHKVTIQDDKVIPEHTNAKRCDTLIITNLDDQPRIMAFGQHEKHVAYDGVSERYLSEMGKFDVKLIQPGTFLFHDHNDEKVQATFTVR
jgi:FtsZ-interacting cell division protein ZipA